MTTLAKLFAVVFFIGFIVFVAALGLGSMAGNALIDHPSLLGLRYLGITFMAGGLALWIAKRRGEGGKVGLTTLIGMLVILGLFFGVIGAIWAESLSAIAGLAGVGFAAAALVIGFLAMLIAPAGPRPLTARWPEGGEAPQLPHVPAAEHDHDSPPVGDISGEAGHH